MLVLIWKGGLVSVDHLMIERVAQLVDPPTPLLYTCCMLYVLALNVDTYCMLYVLALNAHTYCMMYVLALANSA